MSYPKFLPELLESTKIYSVQGLKDLIDGSKESTYRALVSVKKQYIDGIINNDFRSFKFDLISTEICHTSMLIPYFKAKKEDRKIYVIAQDFFSKFKHVNLAALQFKHLPENLTGYVELPEIILDDEGMEIKGFFFYIGERKNICSAVWPDPKQDKPYEVTDKVICFGYSDPQLTTNGFAWTHIPVNQDIRIEDSHKNVEMISLSVIDSLDIVESVRNDYPKHLAIMFNILAYLNTGEPDIREFKNPVRYQSPTSKTPVKADKHLSDTKIVQVGFSFKKERLAHTDEWAVLPFMRWQPCGKGLSEIRLTYVSGHTRHHKK